MTLGERIRSRGMAQAAIRIPHGCNRAEQKKGKGARNEDLLPLLYHKITKGAMKWQLQKDGRYRAKITVGTGANAVPEGILFDRYALTWYEVYKQPHIGVSAQMSYRTALQNRLTTIPV